MTTTTMLTWQASDGHGLEGVRVHFGARKAFRAFARIIRADAGGAWTASYRIVVREDGTLERASITSATAARERHLTLNRTEDGFWLVDTGSGGTRTEFGGAVDVDLATSVMFNAIPVRRLGLHEEAGEHALPVVFVSLPDLEISVVTEHYRTVSTGEQSSVEFRRDDDVDAELTLDADGLVVDCPGIVSRYTAAAAPAPA